MSKNWNHAVVGGTLAAGLGLASALSAQLAPFATLAALGAAGLLAVMALHARNPRTAASAVFNVLVLPICMNTFSRIETRIELAAEPVIAELAQIHDRTGRFPFADEIETEHWPEICPRGHPSSYSVDGQGQSFTLRCEWAYMDCDHTFEFGSGWRTEC